MKSILRKFINFYSFPRFSKKDLTPFGVNFIPETDPTTGTDPKTEMKSECFSKHFTTIDRSYSRETNPFFTPTNKHHRDT